LREDSVILFHSSNYAMWAVDVLKHNNIDNKLIPVPRDLSSDCGYCVMVGSDFITQAEEFLKRENIEFDRIVELK
jgi:hypothetical protein